MPIGVLILVSALGGLSIPSQADVGVVIYSSKGLDARRTGAGHSALIVTDLCPSGIDQLRKCSPYEALGVIITKYADLASDYDNTVFVAPLLASFDGVDNLESLPVLSSGQTLQALQIEYWSKHLRPYLPPLSLERYRALRKDQSAFHAGRTVRRILTLDFLVKIIGAHRQRNSTEPIVLTDPSTQELIPDGYWRETIGTRHVRDSIIITVPATLEQELKLADYIQKSQHRSFNVLSSNCSDFTGQGLLAVFGDQGMHLRPRLLDPADAWITTPLFVATNFLNFAKKTQLPIHVSYARMIPGTRRPVSPVTSIARGALVPSPYQGKVAFSLKVYINVLNPLFGITAFTADRLSGFANLKKLVHERNGEYLSHLANERANKPNDTKLRREQQRAQIVVWGTSSCWKAKQQEFATLVSQAVENDALTSKEKSLTLLQYRPFLLPRFYEKLASVQQDDGFLRADIETIHAPEYKSIAVNFLPSALSGNSTVPFGVGTRAITGPDERVTPSTAFRLMVSVVNYDLTSAPRNRGTTVAFDKDWELLLDTAVYDRLHVPPGGKARENVETCSGREFDDGAAQSDVIQDESALLPGIDDWFRRLVWSPVR